MLLPGLLLQTFQLLPRELWTDTLNSGPVATLEWEVTPEEGRPHASHGGMACNSHDNRLYLPLVITLYSISCIRVETVGPTSCTVTSALNSADRVVVAQGSRGCKFDVGWLLCGSG